MDATVSERALHRVISYWRQAGIVITPQKEYEALQLVSSVLASSSADPFRDCLSRVMEQIDRTAPPAPRITPPLQRTSLSYGDF